MTAAPLLADSDLEVALRAAEDAIWAAYQGSGMAAEGHQGLTVDDLRRMAASAPQGHAACCVVALLRAEALAALRAFLLALPPRFAMPGAGNPDCAVAGHALGEMARLAVALQALPPPAETQETKMGSV